MVKLETVEKVLFRAVLLDDVKFEYGKMYTELYTVYLLHKYRIGGENGNVRRLH